MKYKEDQFYINQVLAGQVNAYAAIVEKHKELVYTIIVKILQSKEDAEEIAQDVFLKAFQSLKDFQGSAKFSTWLYRIAYNAAISKTRKKKWDLVSIDQQLNNSVYDQPFEQQDFMINQETQMKSLKKALNKLSDEENLIVTLFYFNENSIEEISEITSLSVSNVKVRLHRIRKKLVEEIKPVAINVG